MGVKVPHDLSFIGFDNIDYSAYLEVPLTTVEQDFKKIGEEAGQLILKRISNPEEECQRMVIPVKLIERQSTAFLETVVNY